MNEKRVMTPVFENYLLLFETYYGDLMGWCIRTGIPSTAIISQLEQAADEWLRSDGGKEFVASEDLGEGGVDYVHILMNIPPEKLAQHGIMLWTPIYQILKLDADKNLLKGELKGGREKE